MVTTDQATTTRCTSIWPRYARQYSAVPWTPIATLRLTSELVTLACTRVGRRAFLAAGGHVPDYASKTQKQGVLRLQNLAQPDARGPTVTVDVATLFRYSTSFEQCIRTVRRRRCCVLRINRRSSLWTVRAHNFRVRFELDAFAGGYRLTKGSLRSGLSLSAGVLTRSN